MKPGRVKPYTLIGISRVPCSRCGKPSRHQWQCCANNSRWIGLCTECDVGMNRISLDYMKVPGADSLIAEYAMENLA